MKDAFKCALPFALALVLGCAESMDSYRSDLGTETTKDSGDSGETGDTSTVDDSTGDTTQTTESLPEGDDTLACPDDEDPCCEDGMILPDSVICDPQADVQYSCQGDDSCGGAVFARYKPRYCSGANWACTGQKGDWGQWQELRSCGASERCEELAEPEEEGGGVGMESEIACVADIENCPVDFAETVCFSDGWVLSDWPTEDAPSPLPSMTVSADLLGLGEGEVVEMELFVTDRNTLATPSGAVTFSDIVGTVTHAGITVPFYNRYDSNLIALGTGYSFQKKWVLPHFWGRDMAGTWTLKFTDHAYSAPFKKFKLNKWCLRFRDPDVSEEKTTMEAKKLIPAVNQDLVFGETRFELQSDDLVQVDTQTPKLCLALAHLEPTALSVSLVAANGTVYEIKAKDTAVVPKEVELSGLGGEWLTGRYQLAITSESYAFGNQLLGFSINYGVDCSLPDVPDYDPDTGSEPDTGSDTGSDWDSDSESQSGSGDNSDSTSDSESVSDSESQVDSESEIDSESQVDSESISDSQSQADSDSQPDPDL